MSHLKIPSDITIDDANIIRCTPNRRRKAYISHKALARVLGHRDVFGTTKLAREEEDKLISNCSRRYIKLLEETFPQLVDL